MIINLILPTRLEHTNVTIICFVSSNAIIIFQCVLFYQSFQSHDVHFFC